MNNLQNRPWRGQDNICRELIPFEPQKRFLPGIWDGIQASAPLFPTLRYEEEVALRATAENEFVVLKKVRRLVMGQREKGTHLHILHGGRGCCTDHRGPFLPWGFSHMHTLLFSPPPGRGLRLPAEIRPGGQCGGPSRGV